MIVVFVSDSYTPYVSGVVRSIQLTASALIRRGHRVAVVAPRYPGFERSQVDDGAAGAWVERLPSVPAPGQQTFRLLLPVVPRLRQLEGLPVDVVHAHSPFLAGAVAAGLARRYRAPLVFTHHTLYHEYVHYAALPATLVKPFVLGRVGSFCRKASAVIAPTPAVARMLPTLYGPTAPVRVVPTGLDLSPFAAADRRWLRGRFGIPDRAPVLVHVGRLAKEKNVGSLLEALEILLGAHDVLHAVVVGGGPLARDLAAMAGGPRFAGRLHAAGPAAPSDVPRHLAGADVFITASTTETQGLVAVEAMAAGLPVVAPAAGGFVDVIQHGQDGILCDGASPRELAAAAARLLFDERTRSAMAEQALRRAGAFSVDRTVAQLEEVYRQLPRARG